MIRFLSSLSGLTWLLLLAMHVSASGQAVPVLHMASAAIPPAVPWDIALDNDDGISSTDHIISYNTNVKFNGKATPNNTIKVVMSSNPGFVQQTVAGPDGSWSVTFPTIPASGPWYCLAIATDEFGNSSPNSPVFPFTPDLQGPTVASIRQPAAGVYGKGINIELIVTLSEAVQGWPNGGTLSYTYNGQPYNFYYDGLMDGDKLIFRYLVSDGDDLTHALQAGWVFNGITMDHGTMADGQGNKVNFSSVPAPVVTNSITMDATKPVKAGLPVVANGTYRKGDEIFLDQSFSEPVNVTGVPEIPLIINGTYPMAQYVSGSGTSTLRFRYVVPEDLEGSFSVATSLHLLGYTFIRDLAGNTLTDFGQAGMTAHPGVIVDAKAPSLQSTSITRSGPQLDYTIYFSEPVTFSGNPMPYVECMIDGVVRRFNYSGSTSNNATFSWNIPADTEDKDGIEFTNGILGAGLVISDAAGNIAGNTFADSIRIAPATLMVDSKPPVVVAVEEPADGYYRTGNRIAYKVTFNEPVSISSAPYLSVNVGGSIVSWQYESCNNSSELIFSRIINAGYNDADGIQATHFERFTMSDFIQDQSGNHYAMGTDFTPLMRPGSRIIIDNVAPVRTGLSTPVGTYKYGDELEFTVTYDEDMKVTGNGVLFDMMIGSTVMHIPMILQPDMRTLKGTYTVTDGIVDADGVQFSTVLRIADMTSSLSDFAGNNPSLSVGAPSGALYIDGRMPSMNLLISDNVWRKEGETAYLTMEFYEAVQYTGTPVVYVTEGLKAFKYTAVSQPTPFSIRFEYPVMAGDYTYSSTADLWRLGEEGGAITDLAGNAAVFTSSTIAGNVMLDAWPPVISAGQEFNIPEHSALHTPAGAPVAASELPFSNQLQNWTLFSAPDPNGNGTAAFAIDAATGLITVNDPLDLDYETTPVFTLQVRVSDYVNHSAVQTVRINLTNTNDAPASLFLSATTVNEDAQAGDEVATLSSTDPDAGESFYYSLVAGAGDEDNASFSIAGDKLQVNTTLDKHTKASYNIRIRSTDAGGLFLDQAFVIHVTDTSRPVLTWVSPAEGAVVNAPFDIILQSSEPLAGFVMTDFQSNGLTFSNFRALPGNHYAVTAGNSGEGYFSVSVPEHAATDLSGNTLIGLSARNIRYDDTYPTVYLTRITPTPTNQPARFSVAFSENVTGLEASDFVVTSGIVSVIMIDQRNYEVTYMPATNGNQSIYLPGNSVADAAGNGNLASNVAAVQYDDIIPTVTLTPHKLHINAQDYIEIQLSEAVLAIDELKFTVTNGTLNGFSPIGSNQYRVWVAPVVEGPVTIQMEANKIQDAAGNFNAATPVLTLQYDISRPGVTLSTTAPAITNNLPVRVTAIFTEAVSGLTGSNFFAGNATVTNLATSDNITYTFDLYPLSAGVVQVMLPELQVQDNAGNANLESNRITLEYGNVRPVPLFSTQASGSMSAPVYVRVSFMEAVTGFDMADVSISNGSVTNLVVENPREYVFTVEGNEGAEGIMTFSIAQNVMTDAAGNGNAQGSIGINFDRRPPVVNLYTTATTVTGDFEVMAIASGTLNAMTASSFTIYNGILSGFAPRSAGTYSFMVTPQADGDVIVKANHWAITDPAGNGNAEVTLTVRHDLDPPSVTIQAPYGSPVNAGFPVNIVFSEPVTDFVVTDITVNNGVASDLVTSDNRTYSCNVTPAAEGTVGIEIVAGVAKDAVGRLNTAGTRIDILADMTGPMATLTSTASSSVNGSIPLTLTFTERVYAFGAGDVLITNGTLLNWQTTDDQTFTFNVVPSMEGPVRIDVPPSVAQDRAGNYSTAQSLSFMYDVTGPDATLATTATSPTNKMIPVRITFTEKVTGFSVTDLAVTNGTAAFLSTSDNIVFDFEVTPAADGLVEIYLPANRVQDAAGNGNVGVLALQLQYDISKPAVTLSGTTPVAVNAPFVVTATFSENVTGLTAGGFSVSNASITRFTAISTMQYELEVTPAADGPVVLELPADQAFDAATNGNTASGTLTRTYDGTAPGVTLQTAASGFVKGAFEVTVTFSENVTGYDWAEIALTNASYTPVITDHARQWIYLVTPVADGPVTINVPANVAADLAGNPNTAATQIAVTADINLPSLVLSTTAPAVTNGPISVTAVFSETVTGFNATDVAISNGTISGFTTSDNITFTFTVTPSTNGAVTIDVADNMAHDAAGNANMAAAQLALVYDATRPGASITTTATSPVKAAFPVTVSFTEAVTGFTATDVTISNGTITAFATSDNISFAFTVTPSTNGDITIDVADNMAHDAAGNGNTAAAQLALVHDAARPGASITTTATSPVNAAFPVTVSFTEAVTGFTATDVTIPTNGTITGFTTSDNITYKFTVTPAANNAVTIDVAENTAHDAAGNGNTTAAQLALVYDATRPGASITTTATSPVNAAFPVTVSFTEAVTGFNATDVAISNGTITAFATSDNISFAFTVTPSTNGAVTIDVAENTAHDAAGNGNTAAAQLALVYDATRPGASITTTATSPVNAAFPVTVSFTEAVKGFTATDVTISNGTISGFTTSDNVTFTFMLTPATDGPVTINVAENVAHDAAGNGNTAAAQLALVYSITRPGATITTTANSPVDAAFPVTVTFTEAVTGFTDTDVIITNGTITGFTAANNVTFTFTVTPAADGPVAISVPAGIATGAYGSTNTASNTLNLVYDATRPVATLQIAPAAGGGYTATVTFSEPVNALTANAITISNGQITGISATSATVFSLAVSGLAEGEIRLQIPAGAVSDPAGNGNTASQEASVYHSVSAPVVTISSAAAATVNNQFLVTFTFSKPVTGFTAGDVEVTNGALHNLTAADDRTCTATVIPARDGDVSLFVRAGTVTDGGGKSNAASAALTRRYDASRPSVTVSTTATPPVGGAFTVRIRFSEKVTGFTSAWLQLRNATAEPVLTTDDMLFTAVIRPTGGTIEVSVRENAAADAAGNRNTASAVLSVAHDNSLPVAVLSGRNNPYAFGPFVLTIRLSEPSPDFSAAAIHLENGLLSNFRKVSDTHYTATVTPQFAGPVLRISIPGNRFSDAVGNRNPTSNLLQYQTLQSYTIESVFPNPSTGRFVVKFAGVIYETMKIQLVSMTGDVVYRQDVAPNATEARFDIPASVPDGMYQLMIINGPVKRHNIMLIR